MANSCCTLFLLLLVVHGSIQKSSPTSLTYRAAVVELSPISPDNDPANRLNDNAKKFAGYIEQAAGKDVDIIVFPELGLNSLYLLNEFRLQRISESTLIPDPSQNFTPCTNFSIPVQEALRTIACAAQRNSIYVVVNLLEREECSGVDCPSNGIVVYVTSVAFDRQGKIVARYRKAHLDDDCGYLKVTKEPELSTFDTDFGVTFGNIICFDIMFEEALTLTRQLNITDIIFPTAWPSFLPFLSAVQMESGWAYAEDVNLLASGYNKVDWAISGSGIYAGRDGILTAVLLLDHHEEMLIADVRKKNKKTVASSTPQDIDKPDLRVPNVEPQYDVNIELNRGRDFPDYVWLHDRFDNFITEVIAEDGFIVKRLNHNGIECSFQVNLTNLSPPETYRLLANDNVQFFEALPLGARFCAILQCTDDTIGSCGRVRNSSAIFHSITITATYVDNKRTVLIPSTLGSNMLPLKNWSLNQHMQDDQVVALMSLTSPTQNLVTFAIWGRNFEKDLGTQTL